LESIGERNGNLHWSDSEFFNARPKGKAKEIAWMKPWNYPGRRDWNFSAIYSANFNAPLSLT
jgi:hypothetical protein